MAYKKRPKKVNYLANKRFLEELKASNENGEPTEELSKMFMLLVEKYASKAQFANYSYNDEMRGNGIIALFSSWYKFDVEKGKNPFAYFTQIAKNAFITTLNTEKKQQKIRDAQLVDAGLDPSRNYKDEHTTSTYDRLHF